MCHKIVKFPDLEEHGRIRNVERERLTCFMVLCIANLSFLLSTSATGFTPSSSQTLLWICTKSQRRFCHLSKVMMAVMSH